MINDYSPPYRLVGGFVVPGSTVLGQRSHGGDRSKSDNVTLAEPESRGSSKTYALRRLRKDAPELHSEVIAGRLTAHAAMVQAGLRPKTFTVRAESAESVAATLRRRLEPGVLAEVAALLRD